MIAHNFNKRGICIYAKPHISITVLDYTYDFQEYIWCSVSLSKGEHFLLCCIYRSPSSADANDLKLCSMLEDVLHTNYSDTILVGDFNFGCIKWETKSTIMRSVSADLFLDTIGNLFLEQLVNEPTRIRNEQTSSLLDLVLTNNIYFVDEISVQDPIGKSDHVVLDIFVIANTGKVIPIERRLYYKGDYDSMRNYFKSIDWNYLLLNENTQNSWDIFYDHFCFALNTFVPVSNKPFHISKNKWINSNVKFQIKSKRRSFNKYFRRPTKENWLNYILERNKATQLVDETRRSFERKICADIKENPKTFWQYVKAKNMKQNNLYEIKDPEGIMHYDDIGKANLLNEYFTSVFTVDTDFEGCATLENGIGSIYFTTQDILILIDKLNCSKAAGPDGIHSKIIKECSDIFSFIFYLIFHKSIKEGTLPKQWKEGTVRALHKKREEECMFKL